MRHGRKKEQKGRCKINKPFSYALKTAETTHVHRQAVLWIG